MTRFKKSARSRAGTAAALTPKRANTFSSMPRSVAKFQRISLDLVYIFIFLMAMNPSAFATKVDMDAVDNIPLLREPIDASACDALGKKAMSNLAAMHQRTDPKVHAGGTIVKGIYYSIRPDGPNDLVAFWVGCAGVLDGKPFLVFEFPSNNYYFDSDGDGCTDGAGVAAGGAIDPVDFLPALPTDRRNCASGSWPFSVATRQQHREARSQY